MLKLYKTLLLKLSLMFTVALSCAVFVAALMLRPSTVVLVLICILFTLAVITCIYLFISILRADKTKENYILGGDPDVFGKATFVFSRTDKLFFSMLAQQLSKKTQMDFLRKEAQYLALQNQINPHFLYNSLECIRSEAIICGNENVARMVQALASYYRYTVKNLDKLATIREELDNINNYFTIQHYRFGDRLSFKIFIDDEDRDAINALFVPRLALQPIVENAIFHGTEKKPGTGIVTILFTLTSRRLLIRVSDNGAGIPRETLDNLNRRLTRPDKYSAEDEGGIALLNLARRIRLLFGEDFGIRIQSLPGSGTDVDITLPIVSEKADFGK